MPSRSVKVLILQNWQLYQNACDLVFFHSSVICSLCKVIEGYMVCMIGRNFFVLEASSVCSNVVLQLNKNECHVLVLIQHHEVHDLADTTQGIS